MKFFFTQSCEKTTFKIPFAFIRKSLTTNSCSSGKYIEHSGESQFNTIQSSYRFRFASRGSSASITFNLTPHISAECNTSIAFMALDSLAYFA